MSAFVPMYAIQVLVRSQLYWPAYQSYWLSSEQIVASRRPPTPEL